MSGAGSAEPRPHAPRRIWLRAGLLLLAAEALYVGSWALFAPRSFYARFPGAGFTWVSSLPPYNEHLVTDVGGLNLAVAAMLIAAAVWLDRRLVVVSLVVVLMYAVPHLLFHLAHLGGLSTADRTGEIVSLGLVVVLPLVLLVLARGLQPERPRTE